ncbi:hypothetical protein C0992_007212 [Termitomyces sp. T32_za158]|nr:hypothetical protein C0992_007212 [Termitomyces sp. T32_za158]
MSTSKGEGRREDALVKQRNQMREDFERQKQSLINETEKARPSANRFVGQHDSMEDTLKHNTVGLVHLEDFQQKRKELEEAKAREAAKSNDLKDDARRLKKRKKIAKATLSFAMDGDGDGDDGSQLAEGNDVPSKEKEDTVENAPPAKRNKFRKNPDCKKGDAISTFLEKCRHQFPELRGVSVDNLMYIKVCRKQSFLQAPSPDSSLKEDLIIPHHYTFYDFIINKARGKSGPLFNFDVHDDIRLLADATKEKNESHAGKVVERSYYQRNKHIFPASRWEVYDPEKDYGKYTIA